VTAYNSYNTLMGVAQLETDAAQFALPPAVVIGFSSGRPRAPRSPGDGRSEVGQ